MKLFFQIPAEERVETVIALRNGEVPTSSVENQNEKLEEKFSKLLEKYDKIFVTYHGLDNNNLLKPTTPIKLGKVEFSSWENGKKYVEEFEDVQINYSRRNQRLLITGWKKTEKGLEPYFVGFKNTDGIITKVELDLERAEKEYLKKVNPGWEGRSRGQEGSIDRPQMEWIRKREKQLSFENRNEEYLNETQKERELKRLEDSFWRTETGFYKEKLTKNSEINDVERFLSPTEKFLKREKEKIEARNNLGNLKTELEK